MRIGAVFTKGRIERTLFYIAEPATAYPIASQALGVARDFLSAQNDALPTRELTFAERGQLRSFYPCRLTLISLNFDSARSNLSLKSHIASRISRKVADCFALSAFPKVKMLLFRRYPMIVGLEIL
jgi:hypothetical protein